MSGEREHAIDRLRGLVMVLMALDHAGAFFDEGHLVADSVALYDPGAPLPADRFLVRFGTHLCAPTFVFLAGAALALSVARRRARGERERAIDLHLALRGLVLVALDCTLVSLSWWPVFGRYVLFVQVLSAIGASILCMVLLRRFPAGWLAAGAVAFLLASELLTLRVFGWSQSMTGAPAPLAFLLSCGVFADTGVRCVYPLLPWLAMLVLGWCFAEHLARLRARGASPTRPLAAAGLLGVALFVLLRAGNGYGNMALLRRGNSLVEWLHVSKYPPSLSFAAATLGLMALALAALFALGEKRCRAPGRWEPLGVFGRTALFFYLVHVPLIALLAWLTGHVPEKHGGLGAAALATVAVAAVLYPLCAVYGRYKERHPRGWTQYL